MNRALSFINRNLFVELISGAFILLFVYTGVNKLSDMDRFLSVLKQSPLIGSDLNYYVGYGIPSIELLISLALFIPRFRKFGLYSSFFLMIGFTTYLYYLIYHSSHTPCSCGGVLELLSWKQHLVFNICFTLLALLGILLLRKRKNDSTNGISSSASFQTA